jgi:hypothetical protein
MTVRVIMASLTRCTLCRWHRRAMNAIACLRSTVIESMPTLAWTRSVVGGGECLDALPDKGLDPLAGWRVGLHFEDRPVSGLDLGLRPSGDLGQDIATAVDQTPSAQRSGHRAPDRTDQPGRAVTDHEQRRAQTTHLQAAEGHLPPRAI